MKINNEKQSRRSMLKGLFGGLATASAAMVGISSAKASPLSLGKANKDINHFPGDSKMSKGQKPLFSGTIVHGGLVYLAGIGYHEEGDITKATNEVLAVMKRNLEAAGSSMEHVLKVSVFLADLADYDTMNKAYNGNFGDHPPVRTTVAVYGGVPGNSLVEMDCIAAVID